MSRGSSLPLGKSRRQSQAASVAPSPVLELTAALSAKVRGLRSVKHWGLEALAQKAGVSPAAVSKIENGKVRNPGADTLRKLEDALDVLHGYLWDPGDTTGLDNVDWRALAVKSSLDKYARSRRLNRRMLGKLWKVARAPGAPTTTAGWEILHSQIGLYNR